MIFYFFERKESFRAEDSYSGGFGVIGCSEAEISGFLWPFLSFLYVFLRRTASLLDSLGAFSDPLATPNGKGGDFSASSSSSFFSLSSNLFSIC